jgi:hypothetical protein
MGVIPFLSMFLRTAEAKVPGSALRIDYHPGFSACPTSSASSQHDSSLPTFCRSTAGAARSALRPVGLTAGSNAVVAGAVWVEVFGARRLGIARGVYAGLMVVSTAIAPALLGMALAAGIPLHAMAIGTAAWVAAVPLYATSRLRSSSPG